MSKSFIMELTWITERVVLGQVSKPGSVKVEKLMNVERYSHVMHISSTVSEFVFRVKIIMTTFETYLWGATLKCK